MESEIFRFKSSAGNIKFIMEHLSSRYDIIDKIEILISLKNKGAAIAKNLFDHSATSATIKIKTNSFVMDPSEINSRAVELAVKLAKKNN